MKQNGDTREQLMYNDKIKQNNNKHEKHYRYS